MPAPAQTTVQVQPVQQAAAETVKTVDPIADTIREAEMEMERELEIAVSRTSEKAPEKQADGFRPMSKLFAMPAEDAQPQPQPVLSRPVTPVAPAPETVRMETPAPTPAPAPVTPRSAPERQEPSLMEQVRTEAETTRMPKVEDFPPVLKAEIEHRAMHHQPVSGEERGPMGLLKRLTSSLGRKEDEAAPSEMTSAPPAASQQRRTLSPEASMYAPRRGNLDDQGRPVPAQPKASQDGDELDIPAFLRRQSN